MAQFAVWHGTDDEMHALISAIESNCDCSQQPVELERTTPCGGHRMLAFDQRALDGLVFVRRIAERLRAEELSAAAASLSLVL